MIRDRHNHPTSDISAAGFFIIRTPLLPMQELVQWGDDLTCGLRWQLNDPPECVQAAWKDDVALLRARLRALLTRPEILHALFVASPSLCEGIESWKQDPDSKKGIQAERALVRYFARMSGRATPFGLYSGCSLGHIADERAASSPTITLAPASHYKLTTRLDFDYLFALTTRLQKDPAIALELKYVTNSSLYRAGEVWQYVESRLLGTQRSHHLVKVDTDAYLEAVLARARATATIDELVAAVRAVPGDVDIPEEEALAYILQLTQCDLLVSTLAPPVTGPSPLDDIIAQLELAPSARRQVETICWARDQLAAIDAAGLGTPPDAYRVVASDLKALGAEVDLGRIFQVDMTKPMASAVITQPVINELLRGFAVLCRMSESREPTELAAFRTAFAERYDRAAVPLLEALDEEIGIGFGKSTSDSSSLIRGLRNSGSSSRTSEFRSLHAVLLRKLMASGSAPGCEIELKEEDLPREIAEVAPQLPDSFAITCAIAATSMDAVSGGDFRLRYLGSAGPDGARLFGRFCHTDPELQQEVQRYLQREEEHDPDCIYAEIVYLPEGRLGNVLCRPVLREFELVYMGRSGAPIEQQIPASDLLVSVDRGEIILYSQKHGRRVIPRLTSAHAFMNAQMAPLYRFLGFLQHQHRVSTPAFSWGPLEALGFLPRVRIGKLVVSSARWYLNRNEIDVPGRLEGVERFIAFQKLRNERHLPRWVVLEESDHTLPTDLDNTLSVDALVHVLKRSGGAVLREVYPSPDELCVAGPEGTFIHELAIPFVRTPVATRQWPSRNSSAVQVRTERTLTPGSEWFYLKLYGGPSTLDDVLTGPLPELVAEVRELSLIDRWFFIRYGDPDTHLRVRFHGRPEQLTCVTGLANKHLLRMVESGRIRKVQIDTYEREIERYGGLEATIEAEKLFCADSDAVLDIMTHLKGDAGQDLRWRIVLIGIEALLDDFGLQPATKLNMLTQWRESFYREFRVEAAFRRLLGDRFRSERSRLEAILSPSADTAFAYNAYSCRSQKAAAVIGALTRLHEAGKLSAPFSDLINSYVHMHVNRFVRSETRMHELVLYDFLCRIYEGRHARRKSASTDMVTAAL